MNDRIISNAEEYLVRRVHKSVSNNENFNDLRCIMYHEKPFYMDIEKLPCTASTFHIHILRSYLKCFHWLHPPFQTKIIPNPINDFNEEEVLIPVIVSPDNTLQRNYPPQCNYLKRSRENVCSCTMLRILQM